VSLHSYRHAEREQGRLLQQAQINQKKAETEAAKSRQVALLLENMIQGVAPEVAKGRDTSVLQEILAKTAVSVSRDFTNQPEVAAEMLNALSQSYADLDLPYQGLDLANQSANLAESRLGKQSILYFEALTNLAGIQNQIGLYATAERNAREALALGSNFYSGDNLTMAGCKSVLAIAEVSQHQFTDEPLIWSVKPWRPTSIFSAKKTDMSSAFSVGWQLSWRTAASFRRPTFFLNRRWPCPGSCMAMTTTDWRIA
jgi:hypothetical protein